MKKLLVFTVLFSLLGCDSMDETLNVESDSMIEALIIGSAESPDPVLEKVHKLEKEGKLKDVIVLESFPVQIHLKASQEVIDDLNSIPRVKGKIPKPLSNNGARHVRP